MVINFSAIWWWLLNIFINTIIIISTIFIRIEIRYLNGYNYTILCSSLFINVQPAMSCCIHTYRFFVISYEGDDCTYIRNRDDVKQLLRSVLPPLSSTELDDEVDKLLKNLPSSDIDADEFLREVINNSFWRESGKYRWFVVVVVDDDDDVLIDWWCIDWLMAKVVATTRKF